VVVEMQPRNDRVRLQLAEALALSGNTEKASVLLDSMARYRDDLQLKMVRTEILIASGKVQEAMDLCVELLKHSPRNKRLRRMLQNLRRKGIRPNR
nr:tetratricopeptide repeat protein [bacterium]